VNKSRLMTATQEHKTATTTSATWWTTNGAT